MLVTKTLEVADYEKAHHPCRNNPRRRCPCWAICGSTAKVDTVPTPAAESALSAPCAPQTRPSSNIIITEPVTQPETVPVTGSAPSPAQNCPQTKPTTIPELTPAEETNEEPQTVVPKSTSEEESITEPPEKCAPTSVAEVQPQSGMVYVPGFGYLQSEGPGERSVSESMYENGNKVGIMG